MLRIMCNNKGFNKDKLPEFKKFGNEISWFHLNFTSNTLENLPQNMFRFIESKIESVDISGNRFTNLPLALRSLTTLRILLLSGNLLTLDEENQFMNLAELMILHLSDNNIRIIKENAFSGLKQLMFLYLDKNAITSIEEDFSLHTPLLMDIILADNMLPDTPNLGNPPILSRIDLSGNQIHMLKSTSFSTLVKVTRIYLDRNNLQSIHKNTFSNLNRLKHVDLSFCNLTSLPAGLFSGSPITDLSLYGNHLTDSDLLVDAIMGSHLVRISITSNRFTYITPRLCQYFNFQGIHLNGNPIDDFPNLTNCTNLIWLGIGNTKITTLHEYQFKGLKDFRRLAWGGSPFNCDCRLSWAVSDPRGFLHHEGSYDNDTCAKPLDKRGKLLKDLSPDNMVCDSTQAHITANVITITTGSNTNPSKASSTAQDIVTVITGQGINKPSMGHNSKKTVITLCCFVVMVILGIVAGVVYLVRTYKLQNIRFSSEDVRYFNFGTEGDNSQDHPEAAHVNTLTPNQPVRMSCLIENHEKEESII